MFINEKLQHVTSKKRVLDIKLILDHIFRFLTTCVSDSSSIRGKIQLVEENATDRSCRMLLQTCSILASCLRSELIPIDGRLLNQDGTVIPQIHREDTRNRTLSNLFSLCAP